MERQQEAAGVEVVVLFLARSGAALNGRPSAAVAAEAALPVAAASSSQSGSGRQPRAAGGLSVLQPSGRGSAHHLQLAASLRSSCQLTCRWGVGAWVDQELALPVMDTLWRSGMPCFCPVCLLHWGGPRALRGAP